MARNRPDHHDQESGGNPLLFALGAAGGLALGYLLARGATSSEPVRLAGARLRERARGLAGRTTPETSEEELLACMEDEVIDALLRDPVLSERGIDVGCIRRGVLELSGSVRTADEADRAVRLARTVEGLETVVNRIEIEPDGRRAGTDGWEERMSGEWTGRQVGMGRRRQSEETDPGADDSQHMREVALEQSDRDQYEDEGIAHSQPRLSARPGVGERNPTRYDEDELDNQEPYGRHAVSTPEQPQAMNSQARVGEGLAPGLELEMEGSSIPVKPHSPEWGRARDDGRS
jgi:hypothetical protein